MPLTFPTQAEQALTQWKAKHKTLPFAAIAEPLGGTRDDEGGTIVWVFPDDTTVTITGHGHAWRAIADLP